MTKYILNSGGLKNNIDGGKKLFAEVVKGLGKNPRVLICLFALPREDWEKKFNEIKGNNYFPDDVNPILSLAFPATFEEQVRNSDAIFINGGDDNLVQYWFRKFDILKIFDGKVIVASSAGSNLLAKYFWTCDWRENMDGFGIISVKFIPHYQSSFGSDDPRGPIDWHKAYEELKGYKEDLPIHALKEGEFIVFEK